ncbi:MAG: hypothetical protein AAFW66_00240 [Pseudomonadota bacterium]
MFLSNCATIPTQDLQLYTAAFEKTRIAGDLMFDEIVNSGALRSQSRKADPCAVNPGTGYRPCFSPELALSDEAHRASEPIDIRIRRAALRTISTYNIMLSELASGNSANTLSTRIDQLSKIVVSASALVPSTSLAVGPAFGAFNALATRLENARASNAAARSLIAAEGDIRNLILFLIEDTKALYALYVIPVKGNRGKLKIALRRAEIRNNTAEAARLRQQIAQLSNPKSGTNKAAQFENLLVTYVRLLNETNNALEQLVARVQAGEGSRLTSTQDFIRKATEIRLLSDQFLTEVRILRDAAR